jgi:protein ImuB
MESSGRRIACLRVPRPGVVDPTARGRLAGGLVMVAPRLSLAEGHPLAFWADASGMEGWGGEAGVAQALVAAAGEAGFPRARAGVAGSCVAAAAATRTASPVSWRVVAPGRDAAFLGRRSLALLPMSDPLRETLSLLGLATCADLARLGAADVELRLGAEGLEAWRLARGDDPRWPFRPPVEVVAGAEVELDLPLASLEPLRFLLRGLIDSVLAALHRRQRVPAGLRLVLRLDDGTEPETRLRPARATGEERRLLDLCTAAVERMGPLPAGVRAVRLEAVEEGATGADQLDAFLPATPDPAALHAALAPLLARWGDGALSLAEPRGAHLSSAAAAWKRQGAGGIEALTVRGRALVSEPRASYPERPAGLPLCLRRFGTPRRIRVLESGGRPAVLAPEPGEVDLEEAGLRTAVAIRAEGPERISGGWWGEGYAREYWLAEERGGRLWLLYREGRGGGWRAEGWLD